MNQSKFPLATLIFLACWLRSSTAWNVQHQKRSGQSSLWFSAKQEDSFDQEYHPKSRKSLLEKSGAVLYRKSVFSPEELAVIRKEVSTCMKYLQEECSSSIAQKRYGATLPTDSSVVKLFKTGSLHRLMEKATGKVCELSSDIPVEIRTYEREGAGMAWHVDDTLYDPEQIEVVWTLENDSDCKTLWKEVGTEQLHSVETEPNSAIILSAGGASHCVTHLKYGKRVILKCAYIEQGAVFREGLHKNQFDKQRKHKKKQRSSGRR